MQRGDGWSPEGDHPWKLVSYGSAGGYVNHRRADPSPRERELLPPGSKPQVSGVSAGPGEPGVSLAWDSWLTDDDLTVRGCR